MALWSFIIFPPFFPFFFGCFLTSHAKLKYMAKYLKIKEKTLSTQFSPQQNNKKKINKLTFQVTSDQSQYMFKMMVNYYMLCVRRL